MIEAPADIRKSPTEARAPHALGLDFHRILNDGGVLGIGLAASSLTFLLGNRLFTEILPPEVMGSVALAQTAGMAVSIWPVAVLSYATRYYSVFKASGNLAPFFSWVKRDLTRWSAVLLAAASAALAYRAVRGGSASSVGLFGFALAAAVPGGIYSVLSALHNAAGRRRTVAFHQVVFNGFRPFIGALAALLILSGESILAGYAILSALVTWSLLRGMNEQETFAISDPAAPGEMPAEVREYRNHMLAIQLLAMVEPIGERWILGAGTSTHDVGLYVAGAAVAGLVTQSVGSIANMTAYPIAFDLASKEIPGARPRRALRLVALVGFLMTAALAILYAAFSWKQGHLLSFFIGKHYASAYVFAGRLALAQGLYQLTNVALLLVGQLLNATRGFVFCRVVAVAAHLVLGILWTPRFGAEGMVWSVLAANLLGLLMSSVLTAILLLKPQGKSR